MDVLDYPPEQQGVTFPMIPCHECGRHNNGVVVKRSTHHILLGYVMFIITGHKWDHRYCVIS